VEVDRDGAAGGEPRGGCRRPRPQGDAAANRRGKRPWQLRRGRANRDRRGWFEGANPEVTRV